jgi:hypothetical protein
MFENPDNRIIYQENIGQYRVSTVWTGINSRWGPEPVGIFETMIFCLKGYEDDLDYNRIKTNTIGEAMAVHLGVTWYIRNRRIKELTKG